MQTHDVCCPSTCQVPATQQMFVGESRTNEQLPAQEESGLHVKTHQLHLAYKDASSPKISKLHPVPLAPRGAPAVEAGCEAVPCDGGCQGCSSSRGQGCTHPPRADAAPRPHCSRRYASPAEALLNSLVVERRAVIPAFSYTAPRAQSKPQKAQLSQDSLISDPPTES